MNDEKKKFFEKSKDILSIYVNVLTIVAILIAIDIFPIRNYPDLEILKPTYLINPSTIFSEKYRKYNFQEKLFLKDSDINHPLLYNYTYTNKYFLPYKRLGDFDWQKGTRGYTTEDLFARLGVDSINNGNLYKYNISAFRSEYEKRAGLDNLIWVDYMEEINNQKMTFPALRLKFNPYLKLKSIQNSIPKKVFDDFLSDLAFFSTKIYSVISISNKSNEPIENIRFLLNDNLETGFLNLVGWTEINNETEVVASSPNIKINISDLRPGESQEFLFKGKRVVSNDNIRLKWSSLGIDKNLVLTYLLLSFLLVVLFYYSSNLYGYLKKIIIKL